MVLHPEHFLSELILVLLEEKNTLGAASYQGFTVIEHHLSERFVRHLLNTILFGLVRFDYDDLPLPVE